MPELITISLVALTVAAVSPLYMILQRHFSVENENLESRKEIAGELLEACELWSSILERTFNEAVAEFGQDGVDAARSKIEKQQNNFNELNYGSLTYDSPVLNGLRSDKRFDEFASACANFYDSAIQVKAIAYRSFDESGERVHFDDQGPEAAAKSWKRFVEQALEDVRREYGRVNSIVRQ